MILSHTRRFIFIKTRKVSGTSMEISLSKNCGGDDIITPISYEDELVRLDEGGCLPQNYGELIGRSVYKHAVCAQVTTFCVIWCITQSISLAYGNTQFQLPKGLLNPHFPPPALP